MTEIEITHKPFNISTLSKIIDLNNSLDVDFNEIQNFFDNYVHFENFKIKNLKIPNLEQN